MTVKDLRCGTKVRTAKGWFNIVKLWHQSGVILKIDLSHNGRPIEGVNAEELAKHVLEVDII